jgi:secreted PhoX family phosphatase
MTAPHIQDLIAARMSRRGVAAAIAALPFLSLDAEAKPARGRRSRLKAGTAPAFQAVAANTKDVVTVPDGYEVRPLIAFGDALFENMPAFDLDAVTRADQERRFGQNCDMIAVFPDRPTFPTPKANQRLLMCVNHEYFDPTLMFPAVSKPTDFTAAQIEAMYAAMGASIVEIVREADGGWRVVRDAAPGAGRNRRITPFTPVVFEGPAAQHPWIRAAGDIVNDAEKGAPAGHIACGTHSNCAGGQTPWGTYLTVEENFNSYFGNSAPAADLGEGLKTDAKVFGYPLDRAAPRPGAPRQFDLAANPTGPSLYGWTVEIDPYDPTWAPRKRTALGRRKGEGAATALSRDGRCVVYSGDDQMNEFVYKFVSKGRFDPRNRLANRDLLNDGQLYVARFEEGGVGQWIPLTLTAANKAAATASALPFKDEGDLMVRAREAARLLGATPMDRPEDVEAIHDARWVGLGPVLVVCTNNASKLEASPGNPRRTDPDGGPQPNLAGHILRLDETGADCAADTFTWDVFALAGDPNAEAPLAKTPRGRELHVDVAYRGAKTFTGDRFACPDNICFDSAMNVWIATDSSDSVFGDCNDAVLAAPVVSSGPRNVKRFLIGPVGAEICGPTLTPDEKTFFCAIQHPGESDVNGIGFSQTRWQGGKPPSSYPHGGDAWPLSTVVQVRKKDGGTIGT